MNDTTAVFSGEGQNPDRQQPRGSRRWILPLIGFVLFFLSLPPAQAQTTAQLSGTVQDASGAVLPEAQVTLIDEATGITHTLHTNRQGLYVFAALVPGSYSVKAEAKGFQAKQVTGVVLHAGDSSSVPAFSLAVGESTTTVTIEAATELVETDNGSRTSVLDSKQIENLVLVGRDTTELLKVLPGATTVSASLSNNSPSFSDVNITVNNSAVGNGVNINGAVNRGGTALLADGANIIDPGNMASSVSIVNPEMVAEVSVQSSNFAADTPFGPVVISTIS